MREKSRSFYSKIRWIEYSSIVGLICIYGYFYNSTSVFLSARWLSALFFVFLYHSVRFIWNSKQYETQLAFLIPLGITTLHRVFHLWNVDLNPLILFTPAILFFSFSGGVAFLSLLILYGILLSFFGAGVIPIYLLFWTPILSFVLYSMFYSLEREKKHFQKRFFDIKTRAKNLLKAPHQLESKKKSLELDEDSQIAKAAANIFRIENVMVWIVQLAAEILHPFSSYFFLVNHDSNNLKIMGFKSKSKFFNPEATVQFDDPGIISWVVHNQKILRYGRLPKELQYPSYYSARERILSCMIFPIGHSGRIEGVFGVDSKRSHSFSIEEEQMGTLIAGLIREIVIVFRNYQEKESHADYMEAFYSTVKRLLETDLDLSTRLKLLIEISRLIKDAEEIAVVAPNEKGIFIVHDAIGVYMSKLIKAEINPDSYLNQIIQGGYETQILDQQKISLIRSGIFSPREPNLRLNSLMIVPLSLNHKIMGVLTLGSRRKSFFKENDKFIFNTLAAQFGSALENALNANRIKQLAITDGLTQVYNHRFFQDSLHKEIQRSRRNESKFSLLMIDIDHFKKFNDTYGHQAGDEVLKNIAALLKEEARDIDIVARYGGEEFVIILIDCDAKRAFKIAERIRERCYKQRFQIDGKELNVTMSIGIASFPDHAIESAQLISIADNALYSAKKNGRNQVVLAKKNES